jgi:hypothetical protein
LFGPSGVQAKRGDIERWDCIGRTTDARVCTCQYCSEQERCCLVMFDDGNAGGGSEPDYELDYPKTATPPLSSDTRRNALTLPKSKEAKLCSGQFQHSFIPYTNKREQQLATTPFTDRGKHSGSCRPESRLRPSSSSARSRKNGTSDNRNVHLGQCHCPLSPDQHQPLQLDFSLCRHHRQQQQPTAPTRILSSHLVKYGHDDHQPALGSGGSDQARPRDPTSLSPKTG